jgi:dipeptidyl aminopeptidase/acylaminoacyl peptidase
VKSIGFVVGVLALALAGAAPAVAQSDAAKRFGAREGVEGMHLSPDGTRVVFLTPGPGSITAAYVADVANGARPKRIAASSGAPERLTSCRWASAQRIVCSVYTLAEEEAGLVGYVRLITVNADGSDLKLISARQTVRALGVAQSGGEVIDWLPESDGAVLMARTFIPESSTGTKLADEREGYGVERVDTTTLKRTVVEQPRRATVDYITDGHGVVRVMAMTGENAGYATGVYRYLYRKNGSREWEPLSTFDSNRDKGFLPLAVDRDLNAAYGFEKENGRYALFRVALDGSLTRTPVFRHAEVDIDDLIRIGRHRRVVGAGYATDKREAEFFDPAVKAIAASLSKALPGLPLVRIVDASTDENRLLLWAGSDVDPGRYYVFDRKARKLMELMLSRPQLENVPLASVKPIRFKAADGTEIPAYLTLPPGSDGKNLPAIVMPHGGPSSRDEWGFDWLAQFFAARGYAVLQPNFRGSSGYGDGWFANNGFKSWKIAIGDVNDGGRWLIKEGIAAPDKLAIVGWSYGGYAALQSAVLDPALYKAIVAVAPVTELISLREEARYFSNYRLVRDFIGTGPHLSEGSPAQNAAVIRAPVLLFHGDRDANVGVSQSRLMESRLKAVGKRAELVVFPGLDHQLDDAAARTQLLDKADMFLTAALGI